MRITSAIFEVRIGLRATPNIEDVTRLSPCIVPTIPPSARAQNMKMGVRLAGLALGNEISSPSPM